MIGANGTSKEIENSKSFEKSLEVWSKLLNDVHKRLSKLENDFETKEIQKKELNRNNADIKDSIANLNARMDKIEKISSVLEIKDILNSFKGTLDVLTKRFSEIVKKLEDLEVKTDVIEKIYHVSQKPLETLMKVIDEQRAVIIKMDKKLEKQGKMILALGKNSKNQITSNDTKAEVVKESNDRIAEKDSENIAGSTGERVAISEIAPDKTSKSDPEKPDTQNLTETEKGVIIKNAALKPFGSSTKISGEVINKSNIDYSTSTDNEKIKINEKKKPEAALTETKEEQPQSVKEKSVEVAAATTPNKSENFKAIGNDFYVKGVTFSDYGSSSIMKGEIKNDSREDLTGASFSLKILGEDGSMIAETELSIISFKSDEIKPFEQLISGVRPTEISKYEIVFKRSN